MSWDVVVFDGSVEFSDLSVLKFDSVLVGGMDHVQVHVQVWRIKVILNKILFFISDSLITCKLESAYCCLFQIRCQSKQGRLRSSVTQERSIW